MRETRPTMRRWVLPTTAVGVTVILSALILGVWPALLQAQGGPPGGMKGPMSGPGMMGGIKSGPGAMMGRPQMGGMMGGTKAGAPSGATGAAAVGAKVGGAQGGTELSRSPAPGKGEPMYPYRLNPFTSPEAGAVKKMPWVRTYGYNWDNYPIGLQVATLPRPGRPTPKPPPPPPPAVERMMRISSIAWAGGQPIATYETASGRTGILKPGSSVGNWQVVEILRDHVVVKNRKTGNVQDAYLRPREKMPTMERRRGTMGPGGMERGRMGRGGMQPGMQREMMRNRGGRRFRGRGQDNGGG